MNCRPGDLALVIGGNPLWIGRMVTCVRLVPVGEEVLIGVIAVPFTSPTWELRESLPWRAYGFGNYFDTVAPYAADSVLLPVRPHPDDVAQRNEVETA